MIKGGNTHALRVPSAHFAISFLSRGMELAMCKMASKLRCLTDQLSVVQRVKRGAELASKWAQAVSFAVQHQQVGSAPILHFRVLLK